MNDNQNLSNNLLASIATRYANLKSTADIADRAINDMNFAINDMNFAMLTGFISDDEKKTIDNARSIIKAISNRTNQSNAVERFIAETTSEKRPS